MKGGLKDGPIGGLLGGPAGGPESLRAGPGLKYSPRPSPSKNELGPGLAYSGLDRTLARWVRLGLKRASGLGLFGDPYFFSLVCKDKNLQKKKKTHLFIFASLVFSMF